MDAILEEFRQPTPRDRIDLVDEPQLGRIADLFPALTAEVAELLRKEPERSPDPFDQRPSVLRPLHLS